MTALADLARLIRSKNAGPFELTFDIMLISILMVIGVQGILIELGSPGGWVAGFVGVLASVLRTLVSPNRASDRFIRSALKKKTLDLRP